MIDEFKGDYRFLSNFYISPMEINGVTFPSVEHYFQAMKATSYEDYLKVAKCGKPGEAKKMGRLIPIRPDWDDVKEQVMEYALHQKFSYGHLHMKLIETGDEELVEGNWWGDEYWGVNKKNGEGLNRLGHLLMKVRDYLIQVQETRRYYTPEQIEKAQKATPPGG